MTQCRYKFILEFTAPNGLATGTSSGWVTRLNHETFDDTVEYVTVEEAILAVHTEILDRLWAFGSEELHVNIAAGRVNGGHVVKFLNTCKWRR